jgi:predicted flap endonuclease-1-like 5' DNA nuclease
MSAHWTCWLGMMVGAGLLGWGIKGLVQGPVIDDKRREVERLTSKVTMLTKLANQPPEVRTVEKRIEVPVERVVIKHVEVPVEKVVERPVDNAEHLARIKALEGEVGMIAGLLTQIAQLQTGTSQAGGRSMEGRVLVPVDNPEHLARIKALEDEIVVIAGFLAQIAQAQTVALEVGGERKSEERVVVPVDNPEHLARIKALEDEVAEIAELRTQIAEIRDASVQAGEKVVEKRVETLSEQNGKAPVDNPEQLTRIKALEGEVAEIAELRAQIAVLRAVSVQAGEKVVEKRVEPLTEKNGEASVETISEHRKDPNPTSAVEPLDKGQPGQESPDDLKQIRGVGPALERFLHKRGVFWFSQVATWNQADIDKFEFLLPNFGGRIQRENWVRSAQVEHYKKYEQWLGDGEPPSESPDVRTQSVETQAVSSRVGEKGDETQVETAAEKMVVQNENAAVETISERSGDLDQAGAVELQDEGQVGRELPDDLKQIRGVGPALERFLHKRGVVSFRQVATWSQADIDKFEFLLPNFGGRIQREHWVYSAQVEYYRKYKQWLGDGEPPNENLNLPAQIAELQTEFVQEEEKFVEMRVETPAETMVVQHEDVPIEIISEPVADLDPVGAVEQSGEGQAVGESLDDLKQIRGVGPALERFLHKRGVFWFSQVATWRQADIDKFEFLLPNFGGRIQRENWVRSAQVEYYRKYKQWLGDGEPPSESLDLPAQSATSQTSSPQAGEQVVEERIETSTAPNEEVRIDRVSEHVVDLNRAGAVKPLDQ